MTADEIRQWFWTKPRRRVRALFQRRDLESELDEELQNYVNLQADELVARGMLPAEARRAVLSGLGGIEQVKEECRDVRGVRYLEDLWRDAGYAVRGLRKTPAFTFGAVVLLALAIAANVMIGSLVRALFFEPVHYPPGERLVTVSQEFTTLRTDGAIVPFSLPEVVDLRDQIQSVERLAAFHYTLFNASNLGHTEQVQGAAVSPELFTLLGVQPSAGREFDSDPFPEPTVGDVVISARLWRRFYASDPTMVGKQIRLDDRLVRVLAIMPADFEFPLPRFDGLGVHPVQADIWQPINPREANLKDRGSTRSYEVVARLKPDANLERLNQELESLSHRWKDRYQSVYQSGGLRLHASPFRRTTDAPMRFAAQLLAAAALIAWAICVANLIAMLLARASQARPQMAIRMAVGASPPRLLRQAMSEGVLLASLACVSGILLGWLGLLCCRAAAPSSSPLLSHLQVTTGVLLAICLLSLVTILLFGFVPGIYSVRRATTDVLRHGRGGVVARVRSHRLRDSLVIGETALALVLLVGAGLLTKSLGRLRDVYPGFKASGVVTMDFSLSKTKYPDEGAVGDSFSKIARVVAHLPGTNSAAFVSCPPFGGATSDSSFTIEDGPKSGRPPDEEVRIITPDYFRVLEIPLLHGRGFDPSDDKDSQPVVMVNRALALRYWGTGDVVGKRIKLDYPAGSGWRTIVGVVGDIKHIALDEPEEPELYLPLAQMTSRRMMLAVRTDRNPEDAIASIQNAIRSIDPEQPESNVRILSRTIADSILPRTLAAVLVAVFALIGLLLAAAGIYAVISYSTIERGHEIAVRMAIGANRSNIIAMVLKQSGRLLVAGALIGSAIALGASALLRPMLYEVSAFDPLMLVSMFAILIGCGLLAAYIPARRATRKSLVLALAHD